MKPSRFNSEPVNDHTQHPIMTAFFSSCAHVGRPLLAFFEVQVRNRGELGRDGRTYLPVVELGVENPKGSRKAPVVRPWGRAISMHVLAFHILQVKF
jgi:hypothetical protein